MRLGQNPAKSVEGVNNPADIAIVLLTYVPFISGYYQDSPEVIRTAITSILENTSELFDLMVFDNGSCKEVQDYLVELKDQKKIQRLVLSDINIGKVNAWNFILRGTTSEFVVFADSDVYFHPGWLEAHLEIFNTYPEVGMLTGRPLRNPLQFSTHTMDWAENNAEVEISKGLLQQWDVYKVHADSVGLEEDEARQKYKQGEDVQLVYKM